MFEGDNHGNGVGRQKYKDLGGQDGLLRQLSTTEQVHESGNG